MNDFNDKGDTFIFKPEKEENKPQINRSEYDEYSSARRSNITEEEPKSSNALTYVAIVLAALLIIVLVAGIFILKPRNEGNINPENEITDTVPEEKEEEEIPEEEEKEVILSCSVVFDSSRIYKTSDGYAILADLYDGENNFDSRKLYITEETDIRETGKRVSAEALVYIIENTVGDLIVFEAEIRESDNTLLRLEYDDSIFEEEIPEEEEVIPPAAPPEETEGTVENPTEEIEGVITEE